MAIPFLIIDGYNLMHAAGIARQQYAAGQMEKCRQQLQLKIASLLEADALARTTLVYDAFASISDDRRVFHKHGMKIVFAPMGHDADSVIERLLQKHSAPRQIIVVSSDHRLHKAARRRKARCVDSEVFMRQLETESPMPGRRRRPAKPTPQIDPAPQVNPGESRKKRPAASDPDSVVRNSPFDDDYLNRLQDDLENGDL